MLALALFTPLFMAGPPPAAAAGPLIADAGESKVVPVDGLLAIAGRAFGGSPPYAFAWAFEGSPDRFDDPAAATTNFDADGLAPGDHSLTLTVTDTVGATASDTVLHNVAPTITLLDVTGTLGPGLPDEALVTGAVDGATTTHTFDVVAPVLDLTATLDWVVTPTPNPTVTSAVNDVDLVLLKPNGVSPSSAGQTNARPEVVRATPGPVGTWTARIEPYLSQPTTYHLTVVGRTDPRIPVVAASNPWIFGALDAQTVRGTITAGVGVVSAWDMDLDGAYELSGSEVTGALPVGTRTIAFKALDARGYEARAQAAITVRDDVPNVRQLHCPNPAKIPSMELGASNNTVCWNHHGHITFALDDAFHLRGGVGRVQSNELHFSPPGEVLVPELDWPVHLEVSLDGLTWTHLDPLHFELVSTEFKQFIDFELAASDEPFRLMRFHQPPSADQEGLSGYVDQGRIDLFLDTVDADGAGSALAAGTRDLTCVADILEDFFELHPCTFGGVNRYDSASLYHTYVVAPAGGPPAVLELVAGSFIVAPWRSDDWFTPISGDVAHEVEEITTTRVYVDASVDGRTWQLLRGVPATYGLPTDFDIALDPPTVARYVRLVPEKHPYYFEYPDDDLAPLHHPRGFFVDSALTVEGLLPE